MGARSSSLDNGREENERSRRDTEQSTDCFGKTERLAITTWVGPLPATAGDDDSILTCILRRSRIKGFAACLGFRQGCGQCPSRGHGSSLTVRLLIVKY